MTRPPLAAHVAPTVLLVLSLGVVGCGSGPSIVLTEEELESEVAQLIQTRAQAQDFNWTADCDGALRGDQAQRCDVGAIGAPGSSAPLQVSQDSGEVLQLDLAPADEASILDAIVDQRAEREQAAIERTARLERAKAEEAREAADDAPEAKE